MSGLPLSEQRPVENCPINRAVPKPCRHQFVAGKKEGQELLAVIRATEPRSCFLEVADDCIFFAEIVRADSASGESLRQFIDNGLSVTGAMICFGDCKPAQRSGRIVG